MFSNVVLGSNNAARSKKFYDAVLGALGHGEGQMLDPDHVIYMTQRGMLIAGKPRNGEPMTISNGLTIGLIAPNKDAVAAAHAAALANGGTCEGPPGPREMARGAEGAYFRDPDGNKFSVYFGIAG
jgi:catechol 2,3-dioxygenase-like lactoylglutathione lyase family enzyme